MEEPQGEGVAEAAATKEVDGGASAPPASSPAGSPSRCVTRHCKFPHKQRLRCIFCRGTACNRCGTLAFTSQTTSALDKVHSSWINDSIIAMQRPSDTLLTDAGLIEQFQRNKVGAIFNLTEPGEHPFCGSGVLASTGFPYSPEKLMASGIRHFNYSWPDMTVPSISVTLDIVQVASHHLNDGLRIAVHCHAGYGRTGIICACVLMTQFRMTAEDAIQLVRKQRPGSIQTAAQVEFVRNTFDTAWKQLLVVFPDYSRDMEAKSMKQSVQHQQQLLTAAELSLKTYRWLPKIFLVCDSFSASSIDAMASLQTLVFASITGLVFEESIGKPSESAFSPVLSSADFATLMNSCKEDINKGSWSLLERIVVVALDTKIEKLNMDEDRSDAATKTTAPAAATGTAAASPSSSSSSSLPSLPSSMPPTNPVHVAVALQLLLDWLDSRGDCLFEGNCLSQLRALLSPSFPPSDINTNADVEIDQSLLMTHVGEVLLKQLCKSRQACLRKLHALVACLKGSAQAKFYTAVRIAISCLKRAAEFVVDRHLSVELLRACEVNRDRSSISTAETRDVFIITQILLAKGVPL